MDATAPTAPPAAALTATDMVEWELKMLSALADLGLELARLFQAEAIAAFQRGDIDRALVLERRFSHMALGVRRAIALRMRLREEQEKARREAESAPRQAAPASRPQPATIQDTGPAAAAAPEADAGETAQPTVDPAPSGRERTHADRPDKVLPLDALVRNFCRTLGFSPADAARAAALVMAGPADAGAEDDGADAEPSDGPARMPGVPWVASPPGRPPSGPPMPGQAAPPDTG